jgi:hypothetical protein
MTAALSVLAEAAGIPRAVARLLVGTHVQEDALLVAAFTILAEEPTLGHAIVI